MLTITSGAIEKLKGILAEEGADAGLRILVMPGGHGLQYMLTPEKEAKSGDAVSVMDGLRVILDDDSASLLEGAEIDYVEEFERTGFVITNPNAPATGGCACGSGGGGCGCGGGGGGGCGGGGGAGHGSGGHGEGGHGGGACACGGH
ncbi:MAG: iron-sulfur cluster assembly accessory protein [Dehalococcoidia bacterium]|nr:iron-sulfur cluster assembly accessory protein [Dehalococcoidia bacterium]